MASWYYSYFLKGRDYVSQFSFPYLWLILGKLINYRFTYEHQKTLIISIIKHFILFYFKKNIFIKK